MSRVYSPICASQTPSGPVGSWKAWKDPVNFRSRNCLSIFIVRYECFSGFICLRPVKSKNRKAVVAELNAYCHRKWNPIVLQSDQGSEFKGAVKGIFRKLPVKLAHSHPHHPHSQGEMRSMFQV